MEAHFEAKMEEIKEINEEAYEYLIYRNPNSCCKAFFRVDVKCPTFENGICESYHRAIIVQRSKPIITMLKDIRIYLMQRWSFQVVFQELEVRKGDESYRVNLIRK
ncbi:hypothetical protein Tco_0256949 [Tanacetum coccineum]